MARPSVTPEGATTPRPARTYAKGMNLPAWPHVLAWLVEGAPGVSPRIHVAMARDRARDAVATRAERAGMGEP